MSDIKACPGCGNFPDELLNMNYDVNKMGIMLRCHRCGIRTKSYADTLQEAEQLAIDRWNAAQYDE